MSGQRINKWKVLEFDRFDHRGEAYWLCQCNCGSVKAIAGYTLRKGTSKGCLKCRPPSVALGCKYLLKGDVAEFFTRSGTKFIVSACDAEKVSKHGWCIANMGYLVATINAQRTLLHHFVLNSEKRIAIDHINGVKTDNRRENLRFANPSQNAQNQNITSRNTSGFKGVHWNKKEHKWQANIRAYNKQYSLGYFPTREDAAIGYNNAAKELHGEFACLNPIGDTEGYRTTKTLEEAK